MRGGLIAALPFLWLTPSPSRAGPVRVDCDAGGTIGSKLGTVNPGDTILISGTCRETVVIPPEMARVTLDGQGKATIAHPEGGATLGAARHTVFIRGRGITIRGFRITGGEDGIHLSGPAHAVIDGNVISHNRGRGVHLDKASVAQLVSNTIEDNGGVGIHVTEQSYARIGFLIPPDRMVRPNTIQNNGGGGVQVERSSSAWIVGNTIAGNQGPGVAVDRGSEADVVGNTINGNRGDGVVVTHNAGVNLQSGGSPRSEGPNHTDPGAKNSGVGIRCSIGGYVDGPMGTLTGMQGAKQFDNSCIDRVDLRNR